MRLAVQKCLLPPLSCHAIRRLPGCPERRRPLLSLDAYSDAVRAFAATALTQGDDQLELFVNALVGDPAAEACVDLRDFLATDEEKSAVSAYLEIGYFRTAPPERRLAWWLFFFEIGDAYQNIGLERHCEPYRLDQPLSGAPRCCSIISGAAPPRLTRPPDRPTMS